MTTFWSLYITILTVGTLLALTWLLFATRKGQRTDTTDQTMGHTFDGIEEYDNPLPRWWFLLFVGTLIFSVGYLALYPGLGKWKGVLPGYRGWLDRRQPVEEGNGARRRAIRPAVCQIRRHAGGRSGQGRAGPEDGRLVCSPPTARCATARTPRAPTASPT